MDQARLSRLRLCHSAARECGASGCRKIEPPGPGPSRRRLLWVGVGAAFAAAAAPAQKVSQAAARYQDQPKNGLSCSACALFRPPAACAVVAGVISPRGWCRFFDLPD
jgi:hypothetical protein